MRAASIIARTLADSVLAITSRLLVTVLPIFAALSPCAGQGSAPKRILILFEGSDTPSNIGRGDARELAMLLGHFNVNYQLKGLDAYAPGELNGYDITFFIGYSTRDHTPDRVMP